jgi:hypothetical protein
LFDKNVYVTAFGLAEPEPVVHLRVAGLSSDFLISLSRSRSSNLGTIELSNDVDLNKSLLLEAKLELSVDLEVSLRVCC